MPRAILLANIIEWLAYSKCTETSRIKEKFNELDLHTQTVLPSLVMPGYEAMLGPIYCACILSESLLCHSTTVEVCLCLVLYCSGDLNPLPAELPW